LLTKVAGVGLKGGRMTLLPADAARLETLRQQLAAQRRELAAIVAQLDADLRLVPPLGDVQWQGPARRAYEMLVDGLRNTLRAGTASLRSAERSTATAASTLAGYGR
jgi:hypothetical protein